MTTTIQTEPGLSPFTIGGKAFNSRLLVGTGKYPTMESMLNLSTLLMLRSSPLLFAVSGFLMPRANRFSNTLILIATPFFPTPLGASLPRMPSVFRV